MSNNNSIFLRAEWRNLIMANYVIDPEILKSYLPLGTELDFYQNRCLVSLVGFQFVNTRVLGIKIPFHTNFEEFNLRFYVKRKIGNEIRRGVVFVKEIVPKPAIAWVARTIYHEPYVTMKMHTDIQTQNNQIYCRYDFGENHIAVMAEIDKKTILPNTEEDFITEHYFGYNKFNTQKTLEYGVEHPKWNTHKILKFVGKCDFEKLYGSQFVPFLNTEPTSVFLVDGSEIVVRKGNTIT